MYQKLLFRLKQIDEEVQQIDVQLAQLPKGNFYLGKNDNYYKWYYNDGKKRTVIPKSNRSIAEQLALQKYLTLKRADLQCEKDAINSYLSHINLDHSKSDELLLHPEFSKLLSPYFTSFDQEISNWINTPYQHNPNYPEQLTHKTSSGIYVRSKSEVLIDFALYTRKIPFRYECALPINNTLYYPDFTIMHLKTHMILYWEHFGKMDDPIYSKNTFHKLDKYASHGIIPSINLITTFETSEKPLTLDMIEKQIRDFLL